MRLTLMRKHLRPLVHTVSPRVCLCYGLGVLGAFIFFGDLARFPCTSVDIRHEPQYAYDAWNESWER